MDVGVPYFRALLAGFLLGIAGLPAVSSASCIELQEPVALLPSSELSRRVELAHGGYQEIRVGWDTCEQPGKFVLKLFHHGEPVARHELTARQRHAFTTTLALANGESYVLAL